MTPARLVVSVPDERLRGALGDVAEGEVIVWDMNGPPPRDEIDIVVPTYLGSNDRLVQLSAVRVRLVQSLSIGYDGVATVLPEHLVFANAAGVHEPATAEMALTLILASQRGIADFVRASSEGRWARAFYPGLADRRVLLVGYGGVGRAIDERLAPFEVTVTRVARRARTEPRGAVHAIDELGDLLPDADIVVVAVPLTDETTHLVNGAFLSRMPDQSLLVNVARGPVAETEALTSHASSGRIRLALDVTDPEPLPSDHPLFALPNVLISPHVGGATPALLPRVVALVHTQIDRMLRGDEPINVVLRT